MANRKTTHQSKKRRQAQPKPTERVRTPACPHPVDLPAMAIQRTGPSIWPLGLVMAAERNMFEVHRFMAEVRPRSMAEANRFLEQAQLQGWDETMASLPEPPPEHDAQILAYAAMEAEDEHEALDLAQKALALDPRCVDACTLATCLTAHGTDDAIRSLREIIAWSGERLDPKALESHRGALWKCLPARPHMRARQRLADILWQRGMIREAMAEYEMLFALNPPDNQGVRDMLISGHLSAGDIESARFLLDSFPKDTNPSSLWSRTLERFLTGGARLAEPALARAREVNGHVEKYLAGRGRIPWWIDSFQEIGGVDEAQFCASLQRIAWKRHPEALKWMKAQIALSPRA